MSVDPRTAELFEGGTAVVDLGCGDGAFLDVVGARYGRSVGIDTSRERLSLRTHPPSGSWEFVLADLDAGIPLPDGSVDAAHANQVIEHIRNPLAFLIDVRRVLRPGGLLVATTPNVRYLKHVARLLVMGRGPTTSGLREQTPLNWDDGHIHFLTPGDFEWIARSAGFADVATWGLIDLKGGRSTVRRLLARNARRRLVREFLSGNTVLVARA